jgi:hypothetical protein
MHFGWCLTSNCTLLTSSFSAPQCCWPPQVSWLGFSLSWPAVALRLRGDNGRPKWRSRPWLYHSLLVLSLYGLAEGVRSAFLAGR